MDDNHIKVLVIEDNMKDFRSISEMLAPANRSVAPFEVIHTGRLASGLARLVSTPVDVILLDLTLPDSRGVDTIANVRTMAPNVPIITLTSTEDARLAVEAMQQGVQDTLVKGNINKNALVRAIRYAIERQRLVAELAKKAMELETRNIELDEFAHTVAHQVQGLLSQMVGYTGYIEMNFKAELNEEMRDLLKRILQSGHKMNNVISELLLLASVRKSEVTYWPLNMGRVVNESLKRLSFQLEAYEGEVLQQETWPVAVGYPSWIEEVWVNYISNGLKYGGTPPRLVLGANAPANGMVRFWVKDNGVGISAVDQRRLFKPHTRLRQVRARGEGLGLSIVRRIIERCGGEVGVESEIGEGSTFWFTLPETQEAPDLLDDPPGS